MQQFIKQNWILILSLLYILIPFDFIPEALLGPLGLIDDFTLIIVLLLRAVVNEVKKKL